MFKFVCRMLVAFGWFVVGWLAHLAMAVYASKGGLRIKGTDEVPLEPPDTQAVPLTPVTRDPYAYGGSKWAGDGCQGRPVNLGVFPDKDGPLYPNAGEMFP